MDKAVDSLDVKDIEKKMYDNLRNFLLKNLDITKDGTIKPTVKNLKEVQKVTFIKDLLLTDEYLKAVGNFVETFDEVAKMNKKYITDELR